MLRPAEDHQFHGAQFPRTNPSPRFVAALAASTPLTSRCVAHRETFAFVRVTPPNTKRKEVKVKIGPPDAEGRTKTDEGDPHTVRVVNFKKTFPAKDPNAKLSDYFIEAWFDKELGPDVFKGKIVEL